MFERVVICSCPVKGLPAMRVHQILLSVVFGLAAAGLLGYALNRKGQPSAPTPPGQPVRVEVRGSLLLFEIVVLGCVTIAPLVAEWLVQFHISVDSPRRPRVVGRICAYVLVYIAVVGSWWEVRHVSRIRNVTLEDEGIRMSRGTSVILWDQVSSFSDEC